MSTDYSGREDAPFGGEIWSKLDELVMGAAKARLSARRILDIEGPYGLALKSVPLQDGSVSEGEVSLSASGQVPVVMLETTFLLGTRDIANSEETGFPLDTEAVSRAATAIAEKEDALILQGSKKLGVDGLLTVGGVQSVKLSDWKETGAAANDMIKAVTALDDAGFHGPYRLALAPDHYNLLLRLYPQGLQTELQHVETIVGHKVVKAPGLTKGGVMIADGKEFASIVIGQDLTTGFIGPEPGGYRFKVSESIAPRVRVPAAVCVLTS